MGYWLHAGMCIVLCIKIQCACTCKHLRTIMYIITCIHVCVFLLLICIIVGRASRLSSSVHAETNAVRGQGRECTTSCGPVSGRHRSLHGWRGQIQTVLGAVAEDTDWLLPAGCVHGLHCAATSSGCVVIRVGHSGEWAALVLPASAAYMYQGKWITRLDCAGSVLICVVVIESLSVL